MTIEFSLVKLLLFVVTVVPFSSSSETKHTKCVKTPDTWKKVDKAIKECQEDVKSRMIDDSFHSNEWHDVIFDHDYETPSWNFAGHEQHQSTRDHSEIDDHHTHHHIPDHHAPIHDTSALHHHPPLQNPALELAHDHPLIQSNAHQIDAPQPHPQSFVQHHHQDHKQNGIRIPNSGHTASLSDSSVEQDHYIDFNDFRKKRHASDRGWVHPSTVPYHDKRIAGCIMQCIFEKNHAVDKLGWPTLDGLVNFYSEGVNEHGYFMATLRAVDYCLKGSSAKYHVNRRSTPENGQTCDVAFDVFDCISDQITDYCSDHH